MNEGVNTVPRQGSITFLIVVTKFLEINLKRERFVLLQSLKAQSAVVRKSGRQDYEVTGRVMSEAKKQGR